MGFVPNMYNAMAISPGLLKTYMDGYAAFRSKSGFNPAEQEVVFLSISHVNGCEYCMAAHSFLADAVSAVPGEVTKAIRADASVDEVKLGALSTFTKIMVSKRGLPGQADVEAFLSSGYTENHILEIILAISVKTISNYTNHLFHTELDNKFTTHKWNDPSA
jgi:AhpD family alkylhydroperoxidase